MTWGPTLRAELAELFREAWAQGHKRHKRPPGCDHVRHWPNESPESGLCIAQLELLEALTVERTIARAARRRGIGSANAKTATATLLQAGLIRTWRAPFRGKQEAWFGELTHRGWRVLLGQQKARRGFRRASRG